MYRIIMLVAAVALTATSQCIALPDDLAYLETLVEDEKALVDAARKFDLHQKALIDWDKKLIREYLAERSRDLAGTKSQEVAHRMAKLEQMWDFVLSYYPNSARALNYYGEYLYDYTDHHSEALRNWQLAVSLDDEFGNAHNNLGLHHMHNGDIRKAMMHLGEALKLEKKNPDYMYNMAQLFLVFFPDIERLTDTPREKLYEHAMKFSKDATKFAPDDYEIVSDYATNFYAAENFGVVADWVEAAAAWRRARPAARTVEERFFTHLNEGRAWSRANQWGKALSCFESALGIIPDSEVTKGLLAKARENVTQKKSTQGKPNRAGNS